MELSPDPHDPVATSETRHRTIRSQGSLACDFRLAGQTRKSPTLFRRQQDEIYEPDADMIAVAVALPSQASTNALASGFAGTALQFDGADDIAFVPDSASLDITSEVTLETWVQLFSGT